MTDLQQTEYLSSCTHPADRFSAGAQHSAAWATRATLSSAVRWALLGRRAATMGFGLVTAGVAVALAANVIASFPPLFDLSTLAPVNGGDGSNGFVLNASDSRYYVGVSVASADLNGDGKPDAIIGAKLGSPDDRKYAGRTYVVFGGDAGASGRVDLTTLDGTNGFVLNGTEAYEFSGYHVSDAGDVNGDGIEDLIIGAQGAGPIGDSYDGKAYVVFGAPDIGGRGAVELSALDGTDGFLILGVAAQYATYASVGGAGDVNGDGLDDVVLGVPWASPSGREFAGVSYVVFGSGDPGAAVLDLAFLDGKNGFAMSGLRRKDYTGFAVNGAGDLNADGIDDVIIGAPQADIFRATGPGVSYVVFGNAALGAGGQFNLSALNGDNGFVVAGIEEYEAGYAVAGAGDVNGDGFDDAVIGAAGSRPGGDAIGEGYVVFGGPDVGSHGTLELASLDGSNGVVLLPRDGRSGEEVSGAGDVNGDGIDDVMMGLRQGYDAGAYVVFGAQGLGAGGFVDLTRLNGCTGVVMLDINNPGSGEVRDVSGAGDVNGDGVIDMLIGNHQADPYGVFNAGEAYVVFGRGPADADTDGLFDCSDNCIAAANADQRDTDGDGFGNACDADIDNDCTVNFGDLGELKARFFGTDPDADFDGDGSVNFTDLGIMRGLFFAAPGPSGLPTPCD